MAQQQNSHLLLKIFVIGGLIAVLVYFFHPGVGQLGLVINGQPVAEPLVRFAAVPALLIVMLFTAVLMLLAFFGVGLFIFLGAIAFFGLGVFIVAPYFWPVLAIIFLLILLMSFGDNKNSL